MILVACEPDSRSGIQSSFIRRTKGHMAMYILPQTDGLNKSPCLLCCSSPKISSLSTHHPIESGLFVDLGDSTCLTYCTQGVMLRWVGSRSGIAWHNTHLRWWGPAGVKNIWKSSKSLNIVVYWWNNMLLICWYIYIYSYFHMHIYIVLILFLIHIHMYFICTTDNVIYCYCTRIFSIWNS